MNKLFTLLALIPLTACAEHPDPTTSAIALANSTGGVCTQETAPLFTPSGQLIENFNCEDHAFQQISALVYNTNQE